MSVRVKVGFGSVKRVFGNTVHQTGVRTLGSRCFCERIWFISVRKSSGLNNLNFSRHDVERQPAFGGCFQMFFWED